MSIFDFTREPISITKPIRLIELFAGYGSQAMALKRIGAKFEHYRVVEFDKYAIASYNAVHGTDFPTMDITKVHAEDLNICDTNAFTYLLTYSLDNAEICDINTPTASTVTSRYYKGIGSHKDNMCIVAMRGRNPNNPSDRTAGSLTEQRLEVNMQGTSNCLTSVQKDNLLLENNIQKVGQISSNGSQCGTVISDNGISANLVAGTHGYANSHIATQYRIRKLTPRECGRLMGVSDEDIDKMAVVNSNTQLYKQFGNSIVVDVMCAMFKNLNIKQGDSNEALQAN